MSDVPLERVAGTRPPVDAPPEQGFGLGEGPKAMYLEVTLTNGQNFSIPIEPGHSVERELELFLERKGRYAGAWVPLQKAGRELFVRYEQILLVSPKSE
ncbi:MAG: hypothetical protein ABW012_00760 [Gaiellaceae bacterium]